MIVEETFRKQAHDAKRLLGKSEKIILATHEHTDGDDLGAMLALSRALTGIGKQVYQVAKWGIPDNLLFLPGHSEVAVELPADFVDYEILVTLGCGDLERLGFAEIAKWDKPILNIDHHVDTKQYGTLNIWNPSAAAVCELVYCLLKEWQVAIDKFMAMCLLTGIFTDTGGFRHANVSPQILEIAAELLRKGAKLEVIARFTFSERELPMLRAWAAALENARFDRERQMVYTVITEEDLKNSGAQEEHLDGVVELLNTIPDARFSMLLRQQGAEIKGSLRSENYKGVDVSQIARAFGGGGHKLAAGFKFKGKIKKTADGWKIT